MNKFLEIFSFIKNNLNGNVARTFIIVVVTLLLYKVLGFIGIILGLIVAIGIDVCKTYSLKEIYLFFKEKFFPIIIFVLILSACGTNKIITDNTYSISQLIKVSKDTISSKDYRKMVYNKQIPSLSKFAKTYLKNTEENKINAYYVYYDSLSNNLYNIKELINNRDTTYIVEKKIMKK